MSRHLVTCTRANNSVLSYKESKPKKLSSYWLALNLYSIDNCIAPQARYPNRSSTSLVQVLPCYNLAEPSKKSLIVNIIMYAVTLTTVSAWRYLIVRTCQMVMSNWWYCNCKRSIFTAVLQLTGRVSSRQVNQMFNRVVCIDHWYISSHWIASICHGHKNSSFPRYNLHRHVYYSCRVRDPNRSGSPHFDSWHCQIIRCLQSCPDY